MAFNFDSGQFNRESTPKRLGNWEVPRWAPTRARPVEYRPNPKPISDLNGHFLPGAPRGTSKCFGHFTGTWDLPRKITRKVAEELAHEPPPGRFPDWLHLRVQRPKITAKGPGRMRSGKREKDKKGAQLPDQTFQECDASSEGKYLDNEDNRQDENHNKDQKEEGNKTEDLLGQDEKKEPVDEDGHGPYVPGTLTSPDHRHQNQELLVNDAVEQLHGPQEDKTKRFWRRVAENAKNNETHSSEQNMKYNRKSETPKLPAVNVSQNFQFAKKMHVGNLEHQPLPDTLGYRNLTKIGEHRDSDIVVKPYAIGWKGYGAAGPTCCTKMRVHRPKTCDPKKQDGDREDKLRPATSMPDLGAQYKKPMSLMDLAICWDFRPDNPKVEPKPPKHIDGSNGSKAPAVFTMVHTPKEEVDDQVRAGHTNPIFNQNQIHSDVGHHPVPYFEKDMTKEKRKDSCEVQYCAQHSNGSDKAGKSKNGGCRNSAGNSKPECDGIHGCGTPTESRQHSNREHNPRPDKLHPIKNAWNVEDKNGHKDSINNGKHGRNSLESYEKTPLAQGKLHHSSSNDSHSSRRSTKETITTNNNSIKHKNCMPCNGNKTPPEIKCKEDYKFAFKAGNPNSVQSTSTTCSKDSKGFKIPKMRHPYSKKSYTIPTLAPPFCIWKGANATGYPEHWRLASVYQHAYKPPEQRRKPLIDSIYQ